MANYDLTYEGSRVQSILDTGDELRDAGYIFLGEATPSTVPGTPTERVAYIGGPGTYTNFGSSITVPVGRICVFKYTGSGWSNQVIDTKVGGGATYKGIATTTTNPGTPLGEEFYIAVQAGTYTNFGSAVVTSGINILKYNGSTWSVDQVIAIDDEPTQGSANLVKSGGVLNAIIQNGPSFDLSAYNAVGGTLATYADLSAALTALNALPSAYKKGGMSMKFVCSSDNKYVQWRYMSSSTAVADFTNVANWQGEDTKPMKNSKNLVQSGGIFERINEFSNGNYYADFPFGGYYKGDASVIKDAGSSTIPLTDFIDISNCVLLSYKLRLGYSSYILTFFDANKDPLVDLCIYTTTGYAQTKEDIVDLTESKYANAKYVRASNYVTENPDYYLRVFPKDLHNLTERDIVNNLTSDLTNKPLSAKQGKVLQNEVEEIRDEIELNQINCDFPYGGYYQGDATSITDEGSTAFPLTDFIEITEDAIKIDYKLTLGNSAYVIIFFDSSKQPLTSISIPANGTLAERIGTIDLQDEIYANAKYFRSSSYYDADYYVHLFTSGKELLTGKDLYFRNLNICALGDSITEGHMNNYVGWPDYLFEMLGNKDGSVKIAHSGAILRTMADECTPANMADKDIVIIMGGTNQNAHFSIGTITDLPTPDDVKANTEYSVNDYVLGGPREQYGWHPSPIYNFSVIYKCTSAGNTGSITTSDITSMSTTIGDSVVLGGATFEVIGYPTWYADLWRVTKKIFDCNPNVRLLFGVPIKMTTAIGHTTWERTAKFQAIRDFCEYNSIQYIDLEKTFALTPYNVDLQNYQWGVMADNTHPNENGYKLLAKMIAEYI